MDGQKKGGKAVDSFRAASEAVIDSSSRDASVGEWQEMGGRGWVTAAELEEKLCSLRNEVGVQLEELAWQIRLLAEQLSSLPT